MAAGKKDPPKTPAVVAATAKVAVERAKVNAQKVSNNKSKVEANAQKVADNKSKYKMTKTLRSNDTGTTDGSKTRGGGDKAGVTVKPKGVTKKTVEPHFKVGDKTPDGRRLQSLEQVASANKLWEQGFRGPK